MKNIFIGLRAGEEHKARLRELRRLTGLGEAEVIRKLIESATVTHAKMLVPTLKASLEVPVSERHAQ